MIIPIRCQSVQSSFQWATLAIHDDRPLVGDGRGKLVDAMAAKKILPAGVADETLAANACAGLMRGGNLWSLTSRGMMIVKASAELSQALQRRMERERSEDVEMNQTTRCGKVAEAAVKWKDVQLARDEEALRSALVRIGDEIFLWRNLQQKEEEEEPFRGNIPSLSGRWCAPLAVGPINAIACHWKGENGGCWRVVTVEEDLLRVMHIFPSIVRGVLAGSAQVVDEAAIHLEVQVGDPILEASASHPFILLGLKNDVKLLSVDAKQGIKPLQRLEMDAFHILEATFAAHILAILVCNVENRCFVKVFTCTGMPMDVVSPG